MSSLTNHYIESSGSAEKYPREATPHQKEVPGVVSVFKKVSFQEIIDPLLPSSLLREF